MELRTKLNNKPEFKLTVTYSENSAAQNVRIC